MQQTVLWTDKLLTDRTTTLFRALQTQELGMDEYLDLVEHLLDSDLAFFLKNTDRSLAYTGGGDTPA